MKDVEKEYLEINRKNWNDRVDAHLTSDFYDVEGFLKGKTSLNDIELALLGDLTGKKVLHLQCHFGQDSISLARMGADVTGVDLSDKAIATARGLANSTKSNAKFICCDLYDLPNHLDEQFDLIFTSYGTIGWLPDIDKWAKIVSQYLKLAGKFVFVEFHPVIWMYDDHFEKIQYRYFNDEAIIEDETGTYAQREADIHGQNITWNHGMGEVVNSLIQNGITIQSLKEYDYSPYNCFQKLVEVEPKKYRIEHFGDKMPMVYAIVGQKKNGQEN
jgi:SAM-dependent methyltransferase